MFYKDAIRASSWTLKEKYKVKAWPYDPCEKHSCPVSCKVREALSGYLHKAQDMYEWELQQIVLADIEKAM